MKGPNRDDVWNAFVNAFAITAPSKRQTPSSVTAFVASLVWFKEAAGGT
jgi:hypothetical protein